MRLTQFRANFRPVFRPLLSLLALSLATVAAFAGDPLWTTFQLSGTGNQNSLAWSPERSEHLIVGTNGSMYASSDAVTWNTRNSGVTTTLYGVAWGNGMYVTVGASGVIRTSPDGTTWTSRTSGTSNDLYAVIWSSTPGTGQWIAAGSGGLVLTSPNGTTWTSRSTGTSNTLRALVWTSLSGGTTVAVGDAGTILVSTDGITWATRTSGTTQSLNGVAWSGTVAMAVGANSTVLTSTNTTSWTTRSLSMGNATLNTVTWGSDTTSGRFLLGGSANNSVMASTDGGSSWKSLNINSNVKFATWDGTRYLILGPNGRTFISHNGVLPGATVAKSPADSATGLSVTPTFAWNALAGIGTWHLQLSTNASFTSLIVNDSSIQDSTYVPGLSVLAENTEYFWRVRARNVAGAGPWTGIRKFRTQIGVPAAPSLVSPATQATAQSTVLSLLWQSAPTATDYAVQLSTSSTFATTLVDDSGLTVLTRAVGPLAFGTVHYWRVRARNAGGYGAWTTTRSFTTEIAPTSAPAAPTLTTPAIFATGVSLSPTFAWTTPAGAQSYQVQLSTVTSFASVLGQDSTLRQTSWSFTGLTASTDYFWRVRAKNSFGYGPWSEISTFKTLLTAPAAPAQNTPAAFATAVANPASLTWTASTGAATYHVQLSLVSDFSSLALNDSAVTGLSKTTGVLTAGTFYYWRVRAKNSAGTSDWSSTRRFTPAAAAVLSVSGTLSASQDFVVSGNTLGFRIATPDRVRVRIADLHGKVLEEVADARFDAGTYELALPAAKHGDLRLLIFRSGAFSRTVPLLP